MPFYRTIPAGAINNTNKLIYSKRETTGNPNIINESISSENARLNELTIIDSTYKHIRKIAKNGQTLYDTIVWDFFPINQTMNTITHNVYFKIYSRIMTANGTYVASQPECFDRGEYIDDVIITPVGDSGLYIVDLSITDDFNNYQFDASKSYAEIYNIYGVMFRIYAIPLDYDPVYLSVSGWNYVSEADDCRIYFTVSDATETVNNDMITKPECLLYHHWLQGYNFKDLSEAISGSQIELYGTGNMGNPSSQIIFSYGYRSGNSDDIHVIEDSSLHMQSSSYTPCFPLHLLHVNSQNNQINGWDNNGSNATYSNYIYANPSYNQTQIGGIPSCPRYTDMYKNLHVYYRAGNIRKPALIKDYSVYYPGGNAQVIGNIINPSISGKNGYSILFHKSNGIPYIEIKLGITV